MKIRNGFVSNSSTSSFVILGYKLTSALEKHLVESGIIPPNEERGDYADEDLRDYIECCEDIKWPKNIEIVSGIENLSGEFIGVYIDGNTANQILEMSQKLKESLKMEKDPVVFSDAGYPA